MPIFDQRAWRLAAPSLPRSDMPRAADPLPLPGRSDLHQRIGADVMLIREPVQHLLIPGQDQRCGCRRGRPDLLLLREPVRRAAMISSPSVSIGADVADAGSLGALDGAVAGEDAVLLVSDDWSERRRSAAGISLISSEDRSVRFRAFLWSDQAVD